MSLTLLLPAAPEYSNTYGLNPFLLYWLYWTALGSIVAVQLGFIPVELRQSCSSSVDVNLCDYHEVLLLQRQRQERLYFVR